MEWIGVRVTLPLLLCVVSGVASVALARSERKRSLTYSADNEIIGAVSDVSGGVGNVVRMVHRACRGE